MFEIAQTEVYRSWFKKLRDRNAKARVDLRLERLARGNFGDVRFVGAGVLELRIDYGPGYRLYFMQRDLFPSSFSQAATRVLRRGISRQRCASRATFRSSNGKDCDHALRRG